MLRWPIDTDGSLIQFKFISEYLTNSDRICGLVEIKGSDGGGEGESQGVRETPKEAA